MKKKKYISIISLIVASLLLFTGCNPLRSEDTIVNSWEETITQWNETAPNKLDKHITMEVSDTYRMDADIVIPEELDSYEVDTIYLTRHIYENPEETLQEWLEYCEIEIEKQIEISETDDILETGKKMKCAYVEFGEDTMSNAQVRSTNALMILSEMGTYTADFLNESFADVMFNKGNKMPYEIMKEPTEKKLISETEILSIKEKLEQIFGISFLEDYTLYTMTKERMEEALELEKQYYESIGMEKYKDTIITEDSEGCRIHFLQGYQGIPIIPYATSYTETNATWLVGNSCHVGYSKGKIEYFNMENPYDIKDVAETVKILPLGEMVKKHAENLSVWDTTVVKVQLYYLPIYTGENLDFIAKLVWFIQYDRQDDFAGLIREWKVYDAVTGRELS